VNAPKNAPRLWDIFCKVIDNHGDIGVCWRLSADLAARGERVRLWVDDAAALRWMAPQGCDGVEVKTWAHPAELQQVAPGDVLIEAFGCNITPEYIAHYVSRTLAIGTSFNWINLEYLSAEGFVARSHGLPSPVMAGPGAGLTKHFFYPGFTAGTGGLLREPGLLQRQAGFDRHAWLKQLGITVDEARGERLVSLFCYEPPALGALLQRLAQDTTATRLLVTPGRAGHAVLAAIERLNSLQPSWNVNSSLLFSYLPTLAQPQFDELLWACDLNFVRGEDSLVRAIWAGKPFVWQIYPQHDGAHHEKLQAFLDMMEAPSSLRQLSLAWNTGYGPAGTSAALERLGPLDLAGWGTSATALRTRLLAQTDLTSQLVAFVNRLGQPPR
jgi:uncharacterized repeat protein (TIGR03837 family)